MKKIAIIGTGYVGLVTGAGLAELGNSVICLDIDRTKVASLKKGQVPFYEPGLEELVKQGVSRGLLQFTDSYREAIQDCEFCFLALPTPSNPDESCDISFVLQAAKQLAQVMGDYLVVINKSTVPVGTAEKIRQEILETLEKRSLFIPFDVVSNPEFLREGSAVSDYRKPARILLGLDTPRSERLMKELYAPHLDRLQVMDIASSELAKYAANGMLALRVSFMNDLASLCEKLGANIEAIRVALGADPRIGHRYLNPGIGFGGSCLPKDMRALCTIAKASGHPSSLFDCILEINERQRESFLNKIVSHFDDLKGKTLAIWGLSFKPNTDDLREAPSLYLIHRLLEMGASVRVYDPVAMAKGKQLFKPSEQITFCENTLETTEMADGIILVTEWEHFKHVDFEKIGFKMRQKVLFDGRNLYRPDEMQKVGFDYFCIGIPTQREPALT